LFAEHSERVGAGNHARILMCCEAIVEARQVAERSMTGVHESVTHRPQGRQLFDMLRHNGRNSE
jgi:hypothetical protein